MRIFGFEIEFRKEPRWVPRADFLDLSRLVQGIADGVDKNRNAIEANRKRIERAKIPEDGEIEAAARAAIESAARGQEGPEPAARTYTFRTGEPVNF